MIKMSPFTKKLNLFFLLFYLCSIAVGQEYIDSTKITLKDTLSKKQIRKENKKLKKNALIESHHQFLIKTTTVFANLNTTLSFKQPPDGLFSANIDLESNFGLPESNIFITGTMLYFISPRSGLFGQYYGIERNTSHITEKEYIFLDQTISEGSEVSTFFNTYVFSLGYLLTVLRDPKVFLGMYFSVYIMSLETEVSVKSDQYKDHINLVAPLPNFGLYASFQLKEWLYFNANIGFFSIKLDNYEFAGGLYNVSSALVFKPTKWLGLSLNYELFDVIVTFNKDEIPTTIEYNFTGPGLGLVFNF